MIIACPNCGAALELPEEAVGARVQCPECETLFVSRGPEEWKAQTKQRLVKALQPLTTDDAKNIDALIRVVARLRFIEEEAQFRMLEIEDVIQSPLGLMAIIDCASSSAAALASEMSLVLRMQYTQGGMTAWSISLQMARCVNSVLQNFLIDTKMPKRYR